MANEDLVGDNQDLGVLADDKAADKAAAKEEKAAEKAARKAEKVVPENATFGNPARNYKGEPAE